MLSISIGFLNAGSAFTNLLALILRSAFGGGAIDVIRGICKILSAVGALVNDEVARNARIGGRKLFSILYGVSK